tara:strand:+ start:179 stop:454 length:276 start_codon:yes stop_codon:yes gene_type:complete
VVHLPSDEYMKGYRDGFSDGWDKRSTSGSKVSTADEAFPYQKRQAVKKKRKPSKYNKEYAKQYAKLKKKHPRTSFAILAKKAHAATKRAMK